MKVLNVDDHALFRRGLSLVLAEIIDDIDVTEARNLEQAIEAVSKNDDFDLVLLDLSMPGTSGHEGLSMLVERLPGVPVVVVSASENPNDVRTAFERGAKGYIFKSAAADLLNLALPLVLAGEIFVPSAAIDAVGPVMTSGQNAAGQNPGNSNAVPNLTPRQEEVLALLALGESNKEIARKLGMIEDTVKVHVGAILKKLHARNRTEAVVFAVRQGFVSLTAVH